MRVRGAIGMVLSPLVLLFGIGMGLDTGNWTLALLGGAGTALGLVWIVAKVDPDVRAAHERQRSVTQTARPAPVRAAPTRPPAAQPSSPMPKATGPALHKAMMASDLPLFSRLLEAGAPAAWRDPGNKCSLLDTAARLDRSDMAQLLIDHGADVDARHMDKGTPLHTAADNGNTAVAGTLLLAGAHVDLVDRLGNTPLMLAAMNGHADTARVLLQFGANVDHVSPVGGLDARALARKYRHTRVLEVLDALSV